MTITTKMKKRKRSKGPNSNKRSQECDNINKTSKGVVKVSTLKKSGKRVTKKSHGRTQSRILEFMKKNSEYGFSQKALANAINVREQQVNRTMHRFQERGLVERRDYGKQVKGPRIHWFLTELGKVTTL